MRVTRDNVFFSFVPVCHNHCSPSPNPTHSIPPENLVSVHCDDASTVMFLKVCFCDNCDIKVVATEFSIQLVQSVWFSYGRRIDNVYARQTSLEGRTVVGVLAQVNKFSPA